MGNYGNINQFIEDYMQYSCTGFIGNRKNGETTTFYIREKNPAA
jgi:hypothetical protein